MGGQLTEIIGKRDAWGAWVIKPMPYAEHLAALRELELSTGSVALRIRSDVDQVTGARRRDMEPTLDALRASGTCRIIVDVFHVKRQRRTDTKIYHLKLDADGIAEVPFRVACVILARDTYASIFEEVGSPDASTAERTRGLPPPSAIAEVRDLKAQVAQLTALVERLAQQDSKPTAQAPSALPLAPPAPRKRNSKRVE